MSEAQPLLSQTTFRAPWLATSGINAVWTQHKLLLDGVGCGFISLNTFIVFVIALGADTETATSKDITLSSINLAIALCVLSFPVWVYSTAIRVSPKLHVSHTLKFESKISRRSRFWIWLGWNMLSAIAWVVVMILFWDDTWICLGGEKRYSNIHSFQDVCEDLASIWYPSVLVVVPVLINVFLIVDCELTQTVAETRKQVSLVVRSELMREIRQEALAVFSVSP